MAALHVIPLNLQLLSGEDVQAFDCGQELWEVEINEWLKSPVGNFGAADELSHSDNPSWLHYNEQRELVGISSIGPSTASWPKNSSPKSKATCLTWLAVDKRHQKQGFGQQILDFVLDQAKQHYADVPLVKAFVHIASPALGWYCNQRNKFVPIGKPAKQKNGFYQIIVRPVDENHQTSPII